MADMRSVAQTPCGAAFCIGGSPAVAARATANTVPAVFHGPRRLAAADEETVNGSSLPGSSRGRLSRRRRLVSSAAVAFGVAGATSAGVQGAARRRKQRAAAAAVARRAVTRQQQVLTFREPSTGADVVLVGCMHFNPVSIDKATGVTTELSEQGELGAVVLETCPSRWSQIQALQPPGSTLRMLLDNEMQAAAEVAEAAGRPVLLGDQRVEDLGSKLGGLFNESVADLLSPLDGGWQRVGGDIVEGLQGVAGKIQEKKADEGKKPAESEENLGAFDFADILLWVYFPVTFVRYISSALLRAPKVIGAVIGFLVAFALLPENLFTDLFGLCVDVLSIRIFFKALLQNRNSILARSIMDACRKNAGPGKSVVAILGAAHLNGVRTCLLEETAAGD
eukprot:TRINITY_DN32129_c0_g1_i1.p1 TRINITY_DN32129_c0_g1~~TRINITY_DN32129_c0_g1_i1.p1  ORF type:complete len:412 (+),score=89.97 TRINITY_DN32129_c0_g1_i1:55-1236(+)